MSLNRSNGSSMHAFHLLYSFDALPVRIIRLLFHRRVLMWIWLCVRWCVSEKCHRNWLHINQHRMAQVFIYEISTIEQVCAYTPKTRKRSTLCNNVNTWCCKHGLLVDAIDSVMAKIFLSNVRRAKKKNGSGRAEKENGKYFVVVDDFLFVVLPTREDFHPRLLLHGYCYQFSFVSSHTHHTHDHRKLNQHT